MLSSTVTVLEENEESLLSDLALITACTGTGHRVHFGHTGKWLTALSILTLPLVMLMSCFYLQCKRRQAAKYNMHKELQQTLLAFLFR